MITQYIWFLLLALLAEIIGTVSGFGSSILFVPIASLYFDFTSVLGITAVFHVFSNLSKIALFRNGINRPIALKLGIPAVVMVLIGALLTHFLPTPTLELAMTIVVLALAVFLILFFKKPLPQSNFNLYSGGALSGLIAGVAGTGGAIRGLTLAAFQLPKDIFIATSALIDLGVDAARAGVYMYYGYFHQQFIPLIPFLLGISLLGSYIGKRIIAHTSETVFRYLVLIVIVATSIFHLVKYFYHS